MFASGYKKVQRTTKFEDEDNSKQQKKIKNCGIKTILMSISKQCHPYAEHPRTILLQHTRDFRTQNHSKTATSPVLEKTPNEPLTSTLKCDAVSRSHIQSHYK
ncbi:unnamed protein product [Ectocarpus sp. 13 AM-2016]